MVRAVIITVTDEAELLEEPRAERQELRWISLGMKKLFVEPRNENQEPR
ncbi:MAG: hypothetical protein ACI9K1_000027 [Arcticibacterium sp.]